MTDELLNLQPMWDAMGGLIDILKGPLVALLAGYLGLFALGLIFEAVTRSKDKPDV